MSDTWFLSFPFEREVTRTEIILNSGVSGPWHGTAHRKNPTHDLT